MNFKKISDTSFNQKWSARYDWSQFTWDSLHARLKQPLRGMELQEKRHKKDYRIHKICLGRTYNPKMSVNSRLKATKIIGQRKAFYMQRIPEFSCARKQEYCKIESNIHVLFLIRIIVKMQSICNLISWNRLHISDIFNCCSANIFNSMWNARKLEGI